MAMRFRAGAGIVLCLVGWLTVACRLAPPSPTSTPPPTATLAPPPSPTWTTAPSPTPSPLTDAEAIVLIGEQLADHGVALETVRITIKGAPRRVSIRYTSAYDVNGSAFKAQTTLVALAISRAALRVQPPIDGGINLAILAEGDSEIGLRVITIDDSSLDAWADGSLSDQDFVGTWMVGTVTRE